MIRDYREDIPEEYDQDFRLRDFIRLAEKEAAMEVTRADVDHLLRAAHREETTPEEWDEAQRLYPNSLTVHAIAAWIEAMRRIETDEASYQDSERDK